MAWRRRSPGREAAAVYFYTDLDGNGYRKVDKREGGSLDFDLLVQICLFRMQGGIETHLFVRFLDLDRSDPVDDPEHGVGESERPDGRKERRGELLEERSAVSRKQAVGPCGRVARERSECAEKDDSEEPSHPMHPPDIESVVERELVLKGDGEIAYHPGNDPDNDRGCRRNVSGSRS